MVLYPELLHIKYYFNEQAIKIKLHKAGQRSILWSLVEIIF